VRRLKDAVTSNVIPLPTDILLHRLQQLSIANTHLLQQPNQVVWAECSVRTAMRLAGAGQGLGEDFLAAVWRVTPSSPVGITTHITIRMANVVQVFFGELVVGDETEAPAPESDTLRKRQTNTLQEESVLETAEVFEMCIGSQGIVQIGHASRKVGRKSVDVGCGDLGARNGGVTRVGGVGGCE
jgi:hypothetical protein